MPRLGSIVAMTRKNAVKANRPAVRPRITAIPADGPMARWPNTASTVAYSGKPESTPLVNGPRAGADAVRARTKTVATTIRAGRSHAGGGGATALITRDGKTRSTRARKSQAIIATVSATGESARIV